MLRSKIYPDLRPRSRSTAEGSSNNLIFLKKNVNLFRRVPEAALREISDDAVLRHYAKNQRVCQTGDPASEVWVVREGRLCVHQCGWKGGMLSIEVMVAGDVSGLAAVACRTYPGEVTATRDTTLIAIPRETMIRVIEKHPEVAREILYAYGQRIHYIETLLYLSREKVEKRMIAALLYLYHKFGFSLPLSRAEMGQMAGTTPETAMRVLKNLEERGLLERRRGKVIIGDLPGLKAALEPTVKI